MFLDDNHLLRGPVEPGWSETIHGQDTPGPPGRVVQQAGLPVVRNKRQLPRPYLFLNNGN